MLPCEQNRARKTVKRLDVMLLGRWLKVSGILAALSVSHAYAADIPTPPAGPTGETIIVHGMNREEIRNEVEKMVYSPWYSQVARWDTAFCPLVVGIPEPFHRVVLNHLNRTARLFLKRVSEECDGANVIVLFTENGTEAVNNIADHAPLLGSDPGPFGIPRNVSLPPSKADIAELRKSVPVRWYRSTITTPAPGSVGAVNTNIKELVTELDSSGGIRTQKTTESQFYSIIVIVDLPLSAGSTWGQLADYISFAVLTGPRLGDNFTRDSIMSLFNDGHVQKNAPSGMTSLDMAFLHALYTVEPAQAANNEQGEMTVMIMDSLSHQSSAAP